MDKPLGLSELVDEGAARFRGSLRKFAAHVGVSHQTMSNWQSGSLSRLPGRANLEALSEGLGRDYKAVLVGALISTNYLDEEWL